MRKSEAIVAAVAITGTVVATGLWYADRREVSRWQDRQACVVVNPGQLQSVAIKYDPVSRDTIVIATGRSFPQSFSRNVHFATDRLWYTNNEPIVFGRMRYIKYGMPRVLGVGDVVLLGTTDLVWVFAEPSADRRHPEVIYLPTSAECEFQPYQIERKSGYVRGTE